MATARAIQAKIITGLAASTAILDACLSHFNQLPRFLSGGTGRQGTDGVPSFTVVAWSRSGGEMEESRQFYFSLLLSISDETCAETQVQAAAVDLETSVPAVAPYTVTVADWVADAAGSDLDYTVAAGVYTFLAADAGEPVTINYYNRPPVPVDIYAGPSILEELLELAAAVIRGISADLTIENLDYSFEPLEFFPLFIGGLDFTVSYPIMIGGYEPTIT